MADDDYELAAIREARRRYDDARAALFDAIRAAVDRPGVARGRVSAVARAAGFSREYIAKIRDGKGPKGI